jgi:drug/metabolite transporter (DMT)-like permease
MIYSSSMTTAHPSQLARGYTAGLAAAAVLSTTAIFIRHLTQTYGIPALVLAFWRNAFVVLTLASFIAVRKSFTPAAAARAHSGAPRSIPRGQLPFLVSYGLVLALFNAMWTFSVTFNGAAVATVLAYCSAAFTALLAWWLFRERPSVTVFVAIALSLIGCALVADLLAPGAWRMNPLGILTGILSGLGYAGYSLMGNAASRRGLGPWTCLFYTFAFAGLFLLVGMVIAHPRQTLFSASGLWSLGHEWRGWGTLFLLAAGPTVAGFGLYNVSLAHLPSSVANLIVTLEPAFTSVIAYFYLGERLTTTQGLGGMLVLSAVVLLRVSERRPKLLPEISGAI